MKLFFLTSAYYCYYRTFSLRRLFYMYLFQYFLFLRFAELNAPEETGKETDFVLI